MGSAPTSSFEHITASNVSSLFPDVNPSLSNLTTSPTSIPTTNGTSTNGTSTHKPDTDPLSGYDPEQIRLMDELCIVLTPSDIPIGTASKKTCHLMSNITRGLLHRAFSVFLFHPTTKKLLLQQRATEKITFPDMWTNTCCSHPLAHASEIGHIPSSHANNNEEELDLASAVEGAKRAAQRKLQHELGINPAQVPLNKFKFLTRIHYVAPSDGKWGEHEIDYILFIEADVDLDPNVNEVSDTRWVSEEELKDFFQRAEGKTTGEVNGTKVGKVEGVLEAEKPGEGRKEKKVTFTPWFRLICDSALWGWWDEVRDGRYLEIESEEGIRKML